MKTVGISLSAFLFVLASATVALAESEVTQNADGRAKAAQHVKDGKRLLDLGEYDKAIVEYQAAFDLIPHPQMLFNLGQAYQRKGDKVKAAEHYEKYLAIEAKGNSAKQAFEMLAMLKEALAKEAAGPPPVDAFGGAQARVLPWREWAAGGGAESPRPPAEELEQEGECTVERRAASEISEEEFLREFHLKKPLIISGATGHW